MKFRAWIVPAFLVLVAVQALLVVLDRLGVELPLPAKALAAVRLAVALQMLAILALWMVGPRLGLRDGMEDGPGEGD